MKRQTKEQKEAVRDYWQTVDGRDRYRASVFVTKAQSEYWDRLVDAKEAKCAELGVGQKKTWVA